MAKKKATRRTVKRKPAPQPDREERKPHRKADSRPDVEQALAQLRSYYAEGQDSLRDHPNRLPYGEATPEQGVSATQAERLRKARVFAGRYTLDDLDRIERLCREHGMALGRSLIDRLATIDELGDPDARRRLEEEAIKDRWSKQILDREIRQRHGRTADRGRKPRPPQTAEEALSDLVRLCIKLVRFGEAVGWNPDTGRITHDSVMDDLSKELLEELRQTLRAANRLQESAETELSNRRSKRRRRS